MPLDLEKLARMEDQWAMLNEQAIGLGERYRDRLKGAEESRRSAVYRAPDYATHSLARLNEIRSAVLIQAGVVVTDLEAANRHSTAAQRLRAQLDRLNTEKAPLGSLLPRLQRYANPGLSHSSE